ncbi:hypothetical protein [Prochlorothrix hollandica]|uniref:hypothetical protein n=1 Tax=Prochlorothrix hollandica TaxID=1223 RepID=UPI000348355D|nr:hypothetical protein [Prochlorothrix hollandica]
MDVKVRLRQAQDDRRRGGGVLQQSKMGPVVCALRAHITQGVSAIEILTTDLGLL